MNIGFNRVCFAATITTTLALVAAPAHSDNFSEGWKVERKGPLTIYTPKDLNPGEGFSVVAEPFRNLTGKDLPAYLKEQADGDITRLGTRASEGKISRANSTDYEIYSSVQVLRPKSGGVLSVSYILIRRPDGMGNLTRILSGTDQEAIKRRLPETMKLLLGLVKEGASGGTSSVPSEPRPVEKSRPDSRPQSRPADAYTRPGAGVKMSEVLGIYSHLIYQAGVGGYIYPVHQPIVVLKDGTFFEDFDVPLVDFNVAAARTARPKAWSKWRKQGSEFQVLNSKGVWEKEDWLGPLPAAKPGMRLSGEYSSISGGGNTAFGGGTMIAITNDITFFPDGKFAARKVVSGSSHEPNVGASVETGSSRNSDGTYTLEGYMLTLKYADGHVERRSFAFMQPNEIKAIYLNGTPFLQD